MSVPEITVEELKAMYDRKDAFELLDVREQREYDLCRLPSGKLIPLGQLPARLGELNKDAKYVVMCRVGGRSAVAVQFLRQAGFDAANLAGGINAWARRIDPSIPVY